MRFSLLDVAWHEQISGIWRRSSLHQQLNEELQVGVHARQNAAKICDWTMPHSFTQAKKKSFRIFLVGNGEMRHLSVDSSEVIGGFDDLLMYRNSLKLFIFRFMYWFSITC